jgi:hypothetical protein
MIADTPGFVNGAPRLLLRAEGLAVALASIVAFSRSGASWWLFAASIPRARPFDPFLSRRVAPRRGLL